MDFHDFTIYFCIIIYVFLRFWGKPIGKYIACLFVRTATHLILYFRAKPVAYHENALPVKMHRQPTRVPINLAGFWDFYISLHFRFEIHRLT